MYQNATYQIKDIERLTGIKAHTIRIWESRYNIVTPKRTSTNIRFYDETDLRKLLMISLLNRAGLKISEIATLTDEELKEKVNFQYKKSSDYQSHIEAFLLAVNDLNEIRFEKVFNQVLLHFGFENTINLIIEPFWERIEILWSTNSINTAQKNFIFNLINQKIVSATNSIFLKDVADKKRFAIFSPLGLKDNLRINFFSYIIKKNEFQTLFLGSDLSINELIKIDKIKPFSNILTILPNNYKSVENEEFITSLSKMFSEKKIFIIDYNDIFQIQNIPFNLLKIKNYENFINYMKLLI